MTPRPVPSRRMGAEASAARRLLVTATVVAAILASPLEAWAQATSTRGLTEVLVQQDDQPDEIRGYLMRLGSEAVTVLVDGEARDLPLASVSRVQLRGDSLKNGALIGALVGGLWCAFVCGQAIGYDDPELITAIVANAALFAGIGAGFDALHRGRTTIYERPSGTVRRGARASLAYRLRF